MGGVFFKVLMCFQSCFLITFHSVVELIVLNIYLNATRDCPMSILPLFLHNRLLMIYSEELHFSAPQVRSSE